MTSATPTGSPEDRPLPGDQGLTFVRLRDLAREITGRRLPLLPAPEPVLHVVGKLADAAQRRGVDPGFSSMIVYALLHGVAVDDRPEQEARVGSADAAAREAAVDEDARP